MKRKIKPKINYIVVILITLVVLFSIIRIYSSTTKNASFGISGTADDVVQIVDSRYLELELVAPMGGLTGFSFRFEGNRDNFENSGFLVTASIENDLLNPQVLYENVMPLTEQAYDYQNESYIVIIPFNGNIQQGDHLRIAIMGMGMSEKDNITVLISSQSLIADAVFEINDFEQNSIIAGTFYYQKSELKIFPILVQGIIFILLILLLDAVRNKTGKKRRLTGNYQISYKKRMLNLLPVIIFLVVVLEYTYYAGIEKQIQDIKPTDKIEIYPGEEAVYRELCDGEAIFCQSEITEDYFAGFGIYLKEPYDDNGILTIEVCDMESQDLITSAERAIYELDIDEGNFLKFSFDLPIKDSAGKEYMISIYYSGEVPIEFLTVDNEGGNPDLIPLYQKNIFLNLLFFIFSVVTIGFTLVVFICEQNKMKVEKFFLITVIFLGIMFEMVITPFAVPDEAAHIDTICRLSNQMLGIEDIGIKDAVYKRECDIYNDSGIKRTIDVESYKWLYDDWFNTEGNRTWRLSFAADVTASTNELFFLPAAICITIARILGIGFLPMIFLARTTNLLFAAWIIYCALRKLPFGKSILCVIAILPLTLQEIASCSYDALIIAVSLLYISYCSYAIYSKAKLERTDILVIIITAIMLGICKGGAYTPLYLLCIWILIKRGCIRIPQKRAIKIAGIVVAASIILLGLIGAIYVFKQPIDTRGFRNEYYSLTYLIQHPGKTIRIFENTFYANTYEYMIQQTGSGLGAFQISLTFIVPLGYVLLLVLAVICYEKHPYVLDFQNKCVFLTAAILSIMAIHMAFLLSYTNYGSEVISGIQGRYFIPVLWLLLICSRNGKIVNKKKRYRKIVATGYIMGVCAVLQVIITVLTT